MPVKINGIELKSGMVLVDSCGNTAVAIMSTIDRSQDYAIYKNGGQLLKGNLDGLFTEIYIHSTELPHEVIRNATAILNCKKDTFNPKTFNLIKIYPEELIEVTMKDINERFGGKVKIIE